MRRILTASAVLVSTAVALSAAVVVHDSASDAKLAQDGLKKVATSILLYALDDNDRLPSNEHQVVQVSLYIRSYSSFLPFPSDKPAVVYRGPDILNQHGEIVIKSAFIFNPALFGIETNKVRSKNKTVLWSYGPRKHLSFVFRGKTLVAFVDGSVKFVSKAEAKHLRWNP